MKRHVIEITKQSAIVFNGRIGNELIRSFLYFGSFAILIFTLISCDHKMSSDYETVVSQSINIEPDNLNTSITENSIYDTVKFISIDVPDSILIGEITDIKKNNDHYFALDKRNECIYIFNKDWKYSGTLSRQGGGPEEYNEIFNFNIYKDEIVINDLWKVLHYKISNLAYISSYNKEHMSFKTYVTNDGHVINHQLNSPMDDSQFNITVYNYFTSEITQRSHPIPKNMDGFTFSQKSHFYSDGLEEYFILPYNDTIFSVQNGKFNFHRVVNFNSKNLDLGKLEGKKVSASDIVRSGDAYFLGDYLENKNHELFMFSLEGRRFKYQISKVNNSGIGFNSLQQNKSVLMLPID